MKYAIVTGSNSEIGVSLVKTLLARNFFVVATYHNDKNNLDIIKNDNLKLKYCNLASEENIEELVAEIPNLDLIINAAAVCFDCNFEEKSKKEFMKTYEINVVAPFLLAKHIKKGHIINISSADGIDTYNDVSMDYCASKAALNNLTKTLSMALPNVNVTALALGWVDIKKNESIAPNYLKSEMQRTKQVRLVNLSEINDYVMKILENKYKTGSVIRIDGETENVY